MSWRETTRWQFAPALVPPGRPKVPGGALIISTVRKTLNPGELGSITDVRLSLTNNAYVSGSNYYLTVIAEEAYGNVKINNADELLIHLTSEQVGSPLKMYSTYGWKATYACKILNDNWLRALIGTRGSRA